ncbi:MAG: helix-turn-helix domain-containing protein [Ruminococcaceae bacterium]|nr:helix-turn-helix domain-containing protein [Oscillospiraceae bacterium]
MNVLLPKVSCVLPGISIHRFPNLLKPFYVDLLVDKRISELHYHDYAQIWYTVSGSYVHTINGQRLTQNSGSLAIVYPFSVHQINSVNSDIENTTVISVSFKNDVFEKNILPFFTPYHSCALFDKMHLSPFMNFTGKEKEHLDELFLDFLYAQKNDYNAFSRRFFANIGKVLELCIKKINTPYSGQNLSSLQERSLHINQTISYITNNCFDKITISDAAKYATMSRSTFLDSFKAHSGITCHEYLTDVRLCRVIGKLPYEDKAIYELADECGFSSSSHFHKVCMDTFGLSPKDLKEYLNSYDIKNSELNRTRKLTLSSLGLI